MNQPQQMWGFFQQMIAQQQQQQMMQQQFQAYIQFCQINRLNPSDVNSFNLFQLYNSKIPIPPIPPKPPMPPMPPKPNPSNDNNAYANEGGIYISNSIEELIPRKEETLYFNNEMKNQPNTMNIYFASSTGFNLMLVVSKFTTFEQLFKDYMNRLSLPHYHIGVNIQFSINGRLINTKSNVQIGEFLKNNSRIDVLDIGNVQGA